MRKQNQSKLILYGAMIANLGLLAYTMKKPRKKDWIFAYIFNATTNAIIDTILVRKGVLESGSTVSENIQNQRLIRFLGVPNNYSCIQSVDV
jgi:hypothetical protein